ncbi:MAG: diguanylate cyclase, partial [Bauldia sp.]
DGSVARTIGTDTDITGLNTVEAALAEEKERLRVTLESIGDGVISTDALGRITFINPVAEQMTGWPSGEAMGKPVAEVFAIVDEATDAPVTNPVAECLAHRRSFQLPGNAVLVGRSGERRDVSDSAAPLKTADGRIMGAVLVFQDVTSSRAFQKELAHSATHDPLTGLPNRVAFEQALLGACEQTGGETREHALCFLDLDRFKKVNDTAGHAAGDKLLQEIAEVIRRGCRSHDLAARIGGDEFALILRDCPLPAAEKVVRQIVDAIATVRFIWNGRTYEVGASVGITAIKPDSPLPSVLMREADDACYAAKAMGRNQLSIHGASAAGDQPARASA